MIHEIHSGFMKTWTLLVLSICLVCLGNSDSLSDDGIALVAFRNAGLFNNLKFFSDWDENQSSPCSWTGVTCKFSRVVSLNITGATFGTCGDGKDSWERQSDLGCPQNATLGTSVFPCNLGGSLAPEIGNLTELRTLVLPFGGLTRNIPKQLGYLRHLQVLDLQHNGFSGGIPLDLGNLSSLQVLNLEGNLLEDQIPQALASCQNLVELNLAVNKFGGPIPPALGNLRQLRLLKLSSNQLNKAVPPELQGACTALEILDLGRNFFTDGIPSWLGNCTRLRSLVLKSNYLKGTIPPELGQLSSLQRLDVSMNQLTGQVPASLGNCLQLSFLVLRTSNGCIPPYTCSSSIVDKAEFNNFNGPFPSSIAALPKLRVLWAPGAGLNGVVPASWGTELTSLNLAQNSLAGDFPEGLGKCQSLVYLDLSSNNLQGQFPGLLPVSCMVVLNVSRNCISGAVPSKGNTACRSPGDSQVPDSPSFVTCSNSATQNVPVDKITHDFSNNSFTGAVPEPLIGEVLMRNQPTYALLLSNNRLSGNISTSFGSCGDLKAFSVDVSGNLISGEISSDVLEKCHCLSEFNASGNRITGGLPKEFGKLTNLTALDVSRNNIGGGIPSQLGDLPSLRTLVLANNSFVGKIPGELGEATSLIRLDLSANFLDGEIPSTLGNLSNLEFLILTKNKLSGRIPETLTRLQSLTEVNLAFNNLTGVVPRAGGWAGLCNNASFQGNRFLQSCAVWTPSPTYMDDTEGGPFPSSEQDSATAAAASKTRHGLSVVVIVAITSGCAIGVVLFILGILVQCTKHRVPGQTSRGGGSRRKDVIRFTNINFNLTYESVVRATGNFGVDFLIGNGGFGATYKAELTPGLVVAVKRLSIGRFQGVQQFDREIRTLGRIRHPNLVTLIGCYVSETEMFLIYNYFPRGNLESFIHNRSRGEITWRVVYRIALGIAEALLFLHRDCRPKVLHRDIKPSNILLDSSLTAYLADFGLARLLGASETHATTGVEGTFGYVAPEYALTCRVSDKADVYSYGVVLLELLSGKRALDPAFSEFGHGFNIVAWACLLISERRHSEVFITDLWESGPENCLLETLRLAVMCTVDSLHIRPTMQDVVDRLRRTQPTLRTFSTSL